MHEQQLSNKYQRNAFQIKYFVVYLINCQIVSNKMKLVN